MRYEFPALLPLKFEWEVLDNLFDVHPDIKNHLVEDDGSLRNFVNIFINHSLFTWYICSNFCNCDYRW